MIRTPLFWLCAAAIAFSLRPAYSQQHIGFQSGGIQPALLGGASAPMPEHIGPNQTQFGSYGSFGVGDGIGAESCGHGESCPDQWTRPCPGITGMAEGVLLRAHATSPATNLGDQYHEGSRYTLGYVNARGQEVRARFFEYDTEDPTIDDIDIWSIDGEYVGRFSLGCNWDGEISLGGRYAKFTDEGANEFVKSIGPMIGLHLRSDAIIWNTSLFGNVRYAHQFGQVPNGNVGTFSVTELQTGVECYLQGQFGRIVSRAFVEAQNWAGDFDGSNEDLGLFGYGVAIGLTR